MTERFSNIIVHKNGVAMLLTMLAAFSAACKAAHDQIFVAGNGNHGSFLEQTTASSSHTHLIRNLLP
jgi:hypothetical protein